MLKFYLLVVLSIVVMVGLLGFVAPELVSSDHTELVFAGFLVIAIAIGVGVFLLRHLIVCGKKAVIETAEFFKTTFSKERKD